MTLRTSHGGLVAIFLSLTIALPSVIAWAQQKPADKAPAPGSQPTTEEQRRRLELLLKIRDEMRQDAEKKAAQPSQPAHPTQPAQPEQPKAKPASTQPATTQSPGQETAQPTRGESPAERRRMSMQEARRRAIASTQAATPENSEASEDDEDVIGPPAWLAKGKEGATGREHTGRAAEPSGKPAEPEAAAPGTLTRRDNNHDGARTDWFNFSDTPWEDVIQVFVERIGKPLMTDPDEIVIGGTLTYRSDRKFTKEEALDELNLIMYEKGYRFVEQEHHVRIIPIPDMPVWISVSETYPSLDAFLAANPRDMDYVRVYYRAKDVSAKKLVGMFTPMLPIGSLLVAEEESNQIKIEALARDVRKFVALVKKVDLSPSDPREMKVFKINTNAREIEQMIRQFMQIGGGTRVQMVRDPRTRRMVPQRVPAAGGDTDVQMIADERTNSIIVKATKDKMEEIEKLIGEFDVPPKIGEFRTDVIEIKHAEATEVANLLSQILQQEQGETTPPNWQIRQRLQAAAQARSRGQRGQPARVQQPTGVSPEDIFQEGLFERARKTIRLVADSRTNSLIVYANDEGFDRVKKMLEIIDKPMPDSYKTITLEHADVQIVAPLVQQIVQGMAQTNMRSGRTPTIVPDTTINGFHIIAEPQEMERVTDLIGSLDVQGAETDRHVVELKNLRPSQVAQMVESLLHSNAPAVSRSAQRYRGRGRMGPSMPTASAQANYQVIPLDDAQLLIVYCTDEDWDKVEETIMLWDQRATTNTPKMETYAITKGDAQSIAQTLAQFYRFYQHPAFGRSPVAIQAEGDQIFVYAIPPAQEEIASLIETMDVEDAGDRIEILPLTNADAMQVAQQVQSMFGGGRGRNAEGPRVIAEPVTNSLIVQAEKADLEKIMDFAARIDEKVRGQEPVKNFYTLRYAQPRDVASAIQQLFGGGTGRRGSTAGQQIRAIPGEGQIIVQAPQDRIAEIEAFIKQLDDPQGREIVIQTLKLPGSDVSTIAQKLNSAFREKPNIVARFDPDPQAETILLTVSKSAVDEVTQLLNEYVEAARGIQPQVQFVQLTRAQAAEAANWLRDQLVTYMQQQLGRRAASMIKVTADSRTNRVVINGPEVAVKYGMELLNQFDAEVTENFISPLRNEVVKLPGLDVRTLARNLEQTFRNEPPRPDRLRASFNYDELTQSIIVSAPQDMYDRIDEVIEKFKQETADLTPEREFIQITQADANYVANQLRQIMSDYITKRRGSQAAQSVSIVPETRLNQVIISAPRFAIDLAKEIVKQLDQKSTADAQLRTISLENADANTVYNIVRQIFNEKIRSRTLQVSVEPITNSLIVGGSNEDYKDIEQWAKELDEQAIAKKGKLQIVELLNANPWEVRNILTAQYGGGGWGRRSKMGQEYSFDVVGGRSLVVQAPEDKLPEIVELIKQLDDIGPDEVEVRMYELPGIGGNIRDLAREVTNAMNQNVGQRERRVTITPYEDADTLIVAARKDQFPKIEDFIDRFKGLVEKETTVTKFIELKHLNAEQYARTIQEMLANKLAREGQRSRSLQSLSITPDPRTNRLICYVPDKIVPDLEEVIKFLDVEPTVHEGEVRSIELAQADAQSVAQTLSRMYQEQRGSRGRDDFSQIPVRIEAEPITNSLLVIASDEDFEQVRKQAIDIDEKTLVQGNQPKVVDLQFADPQEVANLINTWYGGGRRGSRGRNEAQMVQASVTNGVLVVAAPKPKFEEIQQLISQIDQQDPGRIQIHTYDLKVMNAAQVQLAVQGFLRDMARTSRPGQLKPGAFAEPTTNTLVVMAPPEAFLIIDKIIGDLEQKTPKQGEPNTYVLKHVRASEIADNVRTMLQAKVTEREGVKRGTVETAVFAEPGSNRLIVYAPEEYQQLAASIIKMVDEDVKTGEIVHIIPLENGDATQMAQSLQSIVPGGGRGGAGAKVRISADAGSNSILISGLPQDVAQAEGWLHELDINSVTVPELQIFKLEWASAEDVKDLLDQAMVSQSTGRRGVQDQVTVTADDYMNRIYVTANRRSMRQVEQYVKMLDQAPDEAAGEGDMLPGGRQIYFVDVNRGSPTNIAWDVQDLLPDTGPNGPSVEADWFDEYLIVKCRPTEFPRIERLIREFERRAKPELVIKKFTPKADPQALLDYLSARSEGKNVIIEQSTEPTKRPSLVEELWPEGTTPPQVEEREREREQRQRDEQQQHNQPSRQPPVGRQSRAPVSHTGLALSSRLVADLEAEMYQQPKPAPAARLAAFGPAGSRGVVLPAVYQEDEPAGPTTRPGPAPAAPRSDGPEEISGVQVIPDTEWTSDSDEADERGAGTTVPSPVKKTPTRITRQPDGSFILQGPRDQVEDVVDVFDLLEEDLASGEVIRIFKFKYGDVSAAAEVLSIMFDVRQRQVVMPPQARRQQQQQQQRGGQQGEQDQNRQQQNMMQQLQSMVGGRDREGGTQLRMATDPGHNYLIVKCDASALPEIRELLRELDIPPGEVQLRVFQLKNLEAEETADNIRDVLGISAAQQRRGRPTAGRGRGNPQQQQLMEMLQQQMISVAGVEGGAKVERVEIVSNAITNSLMVSAPPEVMGVIENVINQLEGLEGRNVIGIHHYPLKRARAEDVLPLLQEIFDATGGGGGGRGGRGGRGGGGGDSPAALGPVSLSADPRTDTIIFTCESKDVPVVEAQIESLDLDVPLAEAETYVCKYGDAASIASVVESIYGEAGATGGRGQRGRGGAPTAGAGMDVRIVPEPATNTILVWAPPDKRALILARIKELDELNKQDIREIDITYADPEELADTLSQMFATPAVTGGGGRGGRGGRRGQAIATSGRLMIVGDKDTKKLLVRAPDEIFAQIQEIVRVMDQPSEQLKLKTYALRYADAETVVESVKSALAEYVQLSGGEADFDAFTAMPDPRTNSIIVVGSDKTFLFVDRIMAQIDRETPEDQRPQFRLFALENANAQVVADAINSFAQGNGPATGGGRRGRGGAPSGSARTLDVTAVPDEATNSVMVFGRQEDIAVVEQMVISQVDADRTEFATIPVKNVPPSQVVGLIWDLLDQGAQADGGRRGQRGGSAEQNGPQIIPNDNGGTLIVRGTERQIAEVRDLVERFDNPDIVSSQVAVIQIPYGQDPVALASELERLVNESEQTAAAQTGRPAGQVTIVGNVDTQSVIVTGPQALFGKVRTIIDQLKEAHSPQVITRIIQLRTLSAQEAVDAINEMKNNSPGGGSGTIRRSTPSRNFRRSTPSGSRGGRRGDAQGLDRLPPVPGLPVPAGVLRPVLGVTIIAPFIGLTGLDEDVPATTRAFRPTLRDVRSAALPPATQPAGQRRGRLSDRRPNPPAQPPAAQTQTAGQRRGRLMGRQAGSPAEPPAGQEQPQAKSSATRTQPPQAESPATQTQPAQAKPPASPIRVTPPDVMETLSGVSGTLRGDVQAQPLGGQQIVITGDQEDVDFIERVLTMMEATKSPAIIQVFSLEHAKATALAPIIEQAIQSQLDVQGADEQFSINAEGRSNSLIVSAAENIMNRIEQLVGELDQPSEGIGADTVAFLLHNMRAAEAANIIRPILRDLYTQQEVPEASRATITAVERNNSIIAVGTKADLERIGNLVDTIDVKLEPEEEGGPTSFTTADVILVQLKNAIADNVAEVLTNMIEEQQQAARDAGGEKPGVPFVKVLRLRLPDGRELPPLNLDRPIKIISEPGSNSLIIFSSKENNTALTEIVGVFDTLPVGDDTDVKVFRLKHAAAEQIATLVQEMFDKKRYLRRPAEAAGDTFTEGHLPPLPPGVAAQGLPYQVLVQHDARSNTVIVIGHSDAVALAGGIIQELDRPTNDLGMKSFVLQLKRVQVDDLAQRLGDLLDQRAQAIGGENDARDSAVIQPDSRTNSLVIFATPEVYAIVEDLALKLDAADKYGVVDIRYRPLKYADAPKLESMLKEMFDAKAQAEKATNADATDSLTVMADPRSNSLLMTGTRDFLDEAESLISQLDQQGTSAVELRAYKIKLNSAQNVATLLQDVVDKSLTQGDSALTGTPISISADPISDTLMVVAAREDQDLLARWINILDRPSEVGRMTEIIPLHRAVAEDVAQTAQDIFSRSGGGQQAGQVDVTITHDEKTNAVVAFGPPALLKDIADFVRGLDTVEPGGGAIVRTFKLAQADAETTQELLQRILNGEGGAVGGTGGGGGGAQQQVANQVMLMYQSKLGDEMQKALRSEVVVIADARTNQLFVTAPPESMELMESLIKAVDVPPDAAKIRVFQLVNADAQQMVQTLQELFQRRETAGTAGGAGTQESTRVLSLGAGISGREEVSFTTDVRTNSVIAAGTPGYLDLVEQFVLELDTIPMSDRETFVYSPKFIPAEQLAPSIRDFSQEERAQLEQIGEDISTSVLQRVDVTAIPNEDSNRIIIGVDPRYKGELMKVIDDLDRPTGQVMIQVLIIEVTMDNELDLGVEFAFQDLQYSKAGPTDTTTFDYVGGTDIGAAGSGLGGFTFTITGADFNFLFRTLQSEGSLKVLSRPQIVAMHNKPATIDISDDVPYVSGTQTSSTGQISTSVARRSVGIVLEVTPRIAPDGFVNMDISQEVSDLTDSTVDVAPGVQSPVFFTRKAETSIMVKDNETVVLGGLIQSREQNRETKVPILGDLPGLGLLFRSQVDSSKRGELLFVLTPHIIRTADEYRDLSHKEFRPLAEQLQTRFSDRLVEGMEGQINELAPAPLYSEGTEAAPDQPAAPAPDGSTPHDDVYGPIRPTMHKTGEEVDPNSYNIPRDWAEDRKES